MTTDETPYKQASDRARALTGKGISLQTWAICPRIREVNRLMTPRLQERIVEIHPEICFWALANGRPMDHAKRTAEGWAERRKLLAEALGVILPTRHEAGRLTRPAAPDDVLDATAAVWTAWRVAEGGACRLPDDPPVDARGLRMEMVY